MAYRPPLSTWFPNRLSRTDISPRDFHLCANCGVRSRNGSYLPLCPRCKSIVCDPPRGARYDYYCSSCSQKTSTAARARPVAAHATTYIAVHLVDNAVSSFTTVLIVPIRNHVVTVHVHYHSAGDNQRQLISTANRAVHFCYTEKDMNRFRFAGRLFLENRSTGYRSS